MVARALVLILSLLYAAGVYGAVIASVTSPDKKVTIQLTDDKCAIALPPGLEKHLTKAAVWQDTNTYKGCWGDHPQSSSHLILYFEDNTGGAVHRNQFTWAQRG
jgi:hypothetical protein